MGRPRPLNSRPAIYLSPLKFLARFVFENPFDWIEYCNRLIRAEDQDNIVLLTGDPGRGKSTLAMQLAYAFDPDFSLEHVHFTIPELLDDARQLEHYRCVVADEFLMNRRGSMRKDNIDMVEFLQICRGLNLHMLLCFPYAHRLDRAVIEDRIRYMIDVPTKGLAVLMERKRDKRTGIVSYPEILRWTFEKNSGPRWDDYLAKKLLMARQRDAEARGYKNLEDVPLDLPRRDKPHWRQKPRKQPHTLLNSKIAESILRTGKHPSGCGVSFACPTGEHSKTNSLKFKPESERL